MRQLLTLKQVAEALNIGYFRASELTRRGILPAVRIGRQVRVRPDVLEQFIESGGRPLAGGWRRKAPDGREAA